MKTVHFTNRHYKVINPITARPVISEAGGQAILSTGTFVSLQTENKNLIGLISKFIKSHINTTYDSNVWKSMQLNNHKVNFNLPFASLHLMFFWKTSECMATNIRSLGNKKNQNSLRVK